MSNTTRKNRSLTINWPSNNEYFTVNELFDRHPDAKKITLRVRLKKSIDESKTVAVIGTKKGNQGRPALVYCMTPVTSEVIDRARANGIDIVDSGELVKVMEISPASDVTVDRVDMAVISDPVMTTSH